MPEGERTRVARLIGDSMRHDEHALGVLVRPGIRTAVEPPRETVGSSWRVDETYIRTRPRMGYLYRAVDKQGRTLESLFPISGGIASAMAFFLQGGGSLRATLAAQDYAGWAQAESLGTAPASPGLWRASNSRNGSASGS